ncbi:hypothetical protein ETI03_09530 [Macrococcoides canis]|uniref:hypothetical protein n=1 Tax=Macrococcoides canis TaxID=1855823 RepID=UPI00105EC1B6|nr:hypothetical protein [Macrococcus canis]TDM29823.1 hypothetical protein ETI03_09530 [Macrococcus canis]
MDDTLHHIHMLMIEMKSNAHHNYFDAPMDIELISLLVEMCMIEIHIDYFIRTELSPSMRISVTRKGELFITAFLDGAV